MVQSSNNAYSWWAASHIRTKQSKWLEQSLEDMQWKVEHVVKLIEEDGDTFAKRAEMYYKKRPELINFVEESYRAYRALAERYDKLSRDLQTANNTIATVCPEQVQLAMEEEDELQCRGLNDVPKSGLTKDEALDEIDKLKKDILALQTMKEFVKSSYQSGFAKYWGIENQIMEMQQMICRLDESSEGRVIEEDEACTLMAEEAVKSCEEMLSQLLEKQERSAREAGMEFDKLEDAHKKLKSFKHKYLGDQVDEAKPDEKDECAKATHESQSPSQANEEVESLQNKIKEQSDSSSTETQSETQLTEKIDELVNKVVSLETAVSAQTVVIDRLTTEANGLQTQVRILEDDKAALTEAARNPNIGITSVEEKDQNDVENQNSSLQNDFAEARTSLDHLSEKLDSVKTNEVFNETNSSRDEEETLADIKSQEEPEKQKHNPGADEGLKNLSVLKTKEEEVKIEQCPGTIITDTQGNKGTKTTKKHVTFRDIPRAEKGDEEVSEQSRNGVHHETKLQEVAKKADDLTWQQMLLSGLEDREEILLTEYTTILRNYKEVKKRLSDKEKKDKDTAFQITLQTRELKSAIAKRDEEINCLRLKLSLVQGNVSDDGSLKPEDNDENDIKMILVDQSSSLSPIEEKLRMDIDALLDENLDFWLRFSSSFHQIQRFKNTVQVLQSKISTVRDKEVQKGSSKTDIRSEFKLIYKHLREIQNELTLWSEQSLSLKDELKRRFSSLCSIQEDITKALKKGAEEEEEIRFSSHHHASKFQGEVLNMKRENNKVRQELEAGIEHVTTLQADVQKTLRKLDLEFDLDGNRPQLEHSTTRSRIPLRTFLSGKKQKRSIFSFLHNHSSSKPNRRSKSIQL